MSDDDNLFEIPENLDFFGIPSLTLCDCESTGGRLGGHRPECPWQLAFNAQLQQEEERAFPVHTITVTKIEYDDPAPADVFGIDPIKCEYAIEHGKCELRGTECMVEDIVNDIGPHQAIFGVWDKDHRLEVKDYRVRGWTGHTPATPNGPEEWDAGIEEVDDDE